MTPHSHDQENQLLATRRPAAVRRRHGVLALALLGILPCNPTSAGSWVILGDSLSAEYEAVPEFPGVDNPTAYASITVPGWESMSWVEVLGRLRPAHISFGDYRSDLLGWGDLRFSGYKYNFAIPGFTASQFEDIVTSSLVSNVQFLPYRATLESVLQNEAEHAVIWLGANELRANYGFLYDGNDPAILLHDLHRDLVSVVDFVRDQRSELPITLVTIPDVSASPDKQEDHPDPTRRAIVTGIIRQANQAIAEIAADRDLAVADVFGRTQEAQPGEIFYLGALDILPGIHPDNHPRYTFTRDGLHPNTALQFEIARTIVTAFNETHGGDLPQLTDAEALDLLGLDPNLPYWEWMEPFGLGDTVMGADPDADGYPNLAEYAFGMRPDVPDRPEITWRHTSDHLETHVTPDPTRIRHVQITTYHSEDLQTWETLPAERLAIQPDGSFIASLPANLATGFLRFEVTLLPPAQPVNRLP